MHVLQSETLARRAFLRRCGQLAMMGAAAPLGLNLAAMGEAAAQTAGDYKALVCVFLFGGNDYANTVVPFDAASYASYARIRTGIALPQDQLQATRLMAAQPLPGGQEYALHPAMGALAGLFNDGHAAALLNVGPLVVPTTRRQYDARSVPLPPKLFSHNDQQSVWQSQAAEGATNGWGGRLGDLAMAGNSGALFTCVSLSGASVLLAGRDTVQYQCTPAGAVAVGALSNSFFAQPAMRSAFAELLQQPRGHALENAYNQVMRRGIGAQQQVSQATAGVALNTPFAAGNRLAAQLRMVARLIGAHGALGVRRQVFMVSLGGFDLHDDLTRRHPALLQQVSEGMAAFYQATQELGLAQQVTAFTASDFGRTLSSNGDGADHGWGSHHLVVGGAVRGRAFYGAPPPVSVGNTGAPEDAWHVGQGRLLPSTSVDQFAATLGKWFGVSDTDMRLVLPGIGNFGGAAYPTDLGFLQA